MAIVIGKRVRRVSKANALGVIAGVMPLNDVSARNLQMQTLEPGDVIATGTPEGVGFARTPPLYMQEGDLVEVEVEVEVVGLLSNRVEAEQPD